MKTLAPLRQYGKLSDLNQREYLYQLTGQQLGLEYRLELVVTDFQGSGWHSAFALEEVVESMVRRIKQGGNVRCQKMFMGAPAVHRQMSCQSLVN